MLFLLRTWPTLLLVLGLVAGLPLRRVMGQAHAARAGGLQVWERGLSASDAEVRSSSAVSLIDSKRPEAYGILLAALAPGQPAATRLSVLKAAGFRRDGRFVAAAAASLHAKQPELQEASASYLAAVGSAAALKPIENALDSPKSSPDLKVAVIEALKANSSKRVVELVVGQLDSPSVEVRRAAAAALARVSGQRFGDDKAAWQKWWAANRGLTREQWLEGVAEVLRDDLAELEAKDARLEEELVALHQRLVASLAGEEKSAEVLNALASPHAVLRTTAAAEVGELGLAAASKGVRKCLADPSPRVRTAAARALGMLGDKASAQALVARLADDDPSVRVAAAAALGKLRCAGAVEPLCRLVSASDDALAAASVDALGQIGDVRAVRQIIGALKSPAPKVREAAARALGMAAARIDPPRAHLAAQGLAAVLQDPSERVRWYAVHSLAQLGGQRAAQAVLSKLDDDSPRVREAAASELGSIGSPKAIGPLVRLLDDKDERVAQQVAKALMALAGKQPAQAAGLAQVFFDRGDFARAAALWQSQLGAAASPQQMQTLRGKLAQAYAALKDWPQVVQQLAEARKVQGDAPALLERLAQAHLQLKAYGQAAKVYAAFLKATPRPSPAHWDTALRIAKALAEQEQPAAALPFIDALRSAHPDLGGPAMQAKLAAIRRGLAPKAKAPLKH